MNERENINNKQLTQHTINITNDFFSFSQQRDRPSSFTRKSQSKIVNLDHPSFKDIGGDINMSKKLTPYVSRQVIGHEDPSSITNILANLALLIVNEGVGSSRIVMEEIDELLVIEEQEQEQLFLDLEFSSQEIDLSCELPYSPQSSNISRRLFTLENKTNAKNHQ
jgi:hypothetical protein